MVNYDKYMVTFIPNTTIEKINDIKSTLSVDVVKVRDLYLGLPTFSLRKKNAIFLYEGVHL